MDIRAKLEQEHSKKTTDEIVRYIGDDRKRFRSLVDLVLGNDNQLSQRAAWVLGQIVYTDTTVLRPHLGKLLKKLKEPGVHAAIPRNVLRGLQVADIEEKYQAEVFDRCFSYMVSESQPAAVRAFAITTATRIAVHYPELKNELMVVFRELMQLPQSPAVRVRVKSALKTLAKGVTTF